MKSFDTLTKSGKARRLRTLAIKACEQYDLEIASVELVGLYTNAIFRVRTLDRRSFCLRVSTPGWRTETDLLSEAAWLLALHRDTDIGAPCPQMARSGELVITATVEGIPEPRRCLLTNWQPGPLLGKQLHEDNLYKMGVLFSKLHEYSSTFDPPPGFTRRKMDSIYARGEEDVLFSNAYQEAFIPRTRAILEQTAAKVTQAFTSLYADPRGLRVIHNDLWHDNIKVYRGKLYPLDFEDTIWGYPVQDIAMALQDLMMDVKPEAFDILQAAFRRGYTSRSQWPEQYEGQIDVFRAGRMIWVTNYVARYESEYLRKHIDWVAEHFEKFLETGMLRKA